MARSYFDELTLVDFAKEHPEIMAVFRGECPYRSEEKGYLLLTGNNEVTLKLEDKITDLKLLLPHLYIIELPIPPDELERAHSFKPSECIYPAQTLNI